MDRSYQFSDCTGWEDSCFSQSRTGKSISSQGIPSLAERVKFSPGLRPETTLWFGPPLAACAPGFPTCQIILHPDKIFSGSLGKVSPEKAFSGDSCSVRFCLSPEKAISCLSVRYLRIQLSPDTAFSGYSLSPDTACLSPDTAYLSPDTAFSGYTFLRIQLSPDTACSGYSFLRIQLAPKQLSHDAPPGSPVPGGNRYSLAASLCSAEGPPTPREAPSYSRRSACVDRVSSPVRK